jgi:hypothetical protein
MSLGRPLLGAIIRFFLGYWLVVLFWEPTNVHLGSLFCRPVGSGLLISLWVVAALNLAAAALAFCALRVGHELFYALWFCLQFAHFGLVPLGHLPEGCSPAQWPQVLLARQ